MSLLLVVRFLHIASAIWFIGGVISRQIVRAYANGRITSSALPP